MSSIKQITLTCFDEEIGKIGFDLNKQESYFQFNPLFLASNRFSNLIPQTGLIKRTQYTQVYNQYNNSTFRGLPPFIADSLPDTFGNSIFSFYLKDKKLTPIEQLAYVANRGMGAFEYKPSFPIDSKNSIDLTEIITSLELIISQKKQDIRKGLNDETLINIFKVGTSAGGVRPKILIAENKITHEIIPGDITISSDYNHYLVKLSIDEEANYGKELIEFSYYLVARKLGIEMMESKLIDHKHFATLRFDRQNGKKIHTLTASGLTGWDFKSAEFSSYENLFDLAVFLKISEKKMAELFIRMTFNLIYKNTDDHLKNHSFQYNELDDNWYLAPAYDLTYALNPTIRFTKISRALSINNKRADITKKDLIEFADKYSIKNVNSLINQVIESVEYWKTIAKEIGIENEIIDLIYSDIKTTILNDF